MRRLPVSLAALLALTACTSPPVEWREPASMNGATSLGARLALAAHTGGPRVESPTDDERRGWASPPGTACGGAWGVAVARSGPSYAAWWRVRPDSSAELLVARSDDRGRTWSAASVAESRDRSAVGCGRPAPAVAVDSASGTVHVAYWATLPDGPGVFFTHATGAQGTGAPTLPPEHLAHMGQAAADSARAAGVLWHAPVAVVHGERPSSAAVAVRGDTVAVAFEDPNSGPRPRIAVALSREMGHRFELRDHEVSSGGAAASSPLVALRGTTVAVAWREASGRGSDALVVRVGRIDWRAAARPE